MGVDLEIADLFFRGREPIARNEIALRYSTTFSRLKKKNDFGSFKNYHENYPSIANDVQRSTNMLDTLMSCGCFAKGKPVLVNKSNNSSP
jgi:hypothetical protein